MPDWRDAPRMEYEETYGFQRTREETRDLQIYIHGTLKEQSDYAARMAAGLACPSCATPFPAPCDISHLRTWMDECNFQPDWMEAAARSRISKGCCPFCAVEVSPAAYELLVRSLT
jgi:hypothetical protein